MAWSSIILPTIVGEHVVASRDGTEYRIACAGSGRWTVTVLDEGRRHSATLELSGDTYRYATTTMRSPGVGTDWRKLLAEQLW